jgi:DNA-binding MurR/RpiR family transcriptional regulator
MPAPAPSTAGRQPENIPTASTMVNASTTSTSEARNAALTAGAAALHVAMSIELSLYTRTARDTHVANTTMIVYNRSERDTTRLDTMKSQSFNARLADGIERLGPTEQRVAQFLRENREEVLVSSASALASRTGTSDATVIRTVKALGYQGMSELRQELAGELRNDLSLASRMARTLGDVEAPGDSFALTLQSHQQALERLRRDISPALFEAVVGRLVSASRVLVFGIGPSSAMANYLVMQLGRFGIDGASLTDTGLLLADGLHRLKSSDLLIMLAYGRPYREITALIEHSETLGLPTILVTDTLGGKLKRRIDHILPVQRGRADALSLHTATLGLIEAILVGVAAKRPAETVASLKTLNTLRTKITGQPMDLPSPDNPAVNGERFKQSAKKPPLASKRRFS